MKYYNHIIIGVFISLFLTSNINAQSIVTKAESATPNRGVFYSLPQTWFSFDITVQETEYFKGPYAEHAYKYLGLENVNMRDFSDFEIIDIQINSGTQPDPNQYYFVQFDEKVSNKDTRNLLMGLDKNGYLSVVNKAQDASTQKEASNMELFKYDQKDENNQGMFNYMIRPGMVEKVDTIIKVVTVDTAFVEDITFQSRFVERTAEEIAAEAAERIKGLRGDLRNLITGYQEVAYDGDAIRFMHEQLKKEEQEYMSMFTGKSVTRIHTYRYYYTPEKNDVGSNVPLFRFSKERGLVEGGSTFGSPVFINLKSNKTSLIVNTAAERASTTTKGFHYRIPEYGDIDIIHNNNTLARQRFLICQLGTVSFLPSSGNIQVEIHPETGALKWVYME